MGEKARESLSDALSSYLADQAGRSGQAPASHADQARPAGPSPDLSAAYQTIVENYRPARPVEPGAADSPATPPPSGKEQLLQAYDRLVEHEATKPRGFLGPVPAKWRRFVAPTIGILAAAATAYLWIAKPSWLYPRFEPAAPPTTQVGAEQLLISTLIMVQQFEADSGRLPANLNQLGADLGAVSMVLTGDGGYRLLTGAAGRPISLRVVPGLDPQIEDGAP